MGSLVRCQMSPVPLDEVVQFLQREKIKYSVSSYDGQTYIYIYKNSTVLRFTIVDSCLVEFQSPDKAPFVGMALNDLIVAGLTILAPTMELLSTKFTDLKRYSPDAYRFRPTSKAKIQRSFYI